MKKYIFIALLFLAGCETIGRMPRLINRQTVDLSKGNYRVIATSVSGYDYGFLLLGIIPFRTPSYAVAMKDLHWKLKNDYNVDVTKKSIAFINITEDRSFKYFIYAAELRKTITVDVIEFIDGN